MKQIYKIEHVTDLDAPDGKKTLQAKDFFSQGDDSIVQERINNYRRIKEYGKSRFICPECEESLIICGTPEGQRNPHAQHYHFRHLRTISNTTTCSLREGYILSKDEVCRRKYKGLPESTKHKEAKNLIYSIFNNQYPYPRTQLEQRYNDYYNHKLYRIPDISVEMPDKHVVFEIQRTSTSVDTIVGRDLFYQEHNMYILWIIWNVEKETCAKRDIIVDNMMNAFTLDEEAIQKTNESGNLHLRCYYPIYKFNGTTYDIDTWESEIVAFENLLFREKSPTGSRYENYKIYYKDPELLKLQAKEQYRMLQEELRLKIIEEEKQQKEFLKAEKKEHQLQLKQEQIRKNEVEREKRKRLQLQESIYQTQIERVCNLLIAIAKRDTKSDGKNIYTVHDLINTYSELKSNFKGSVPNHIKDGFADFIHRVLRDETNTINDYDNEKFCNLIRLGAIKDGINWERLENKGITMKSLKKDGILLANNDAKANILYAPDNQGMGLRRKRLTHECLILSYLSLVHADKEHLIPLLYQHWNMIARLYSIFIGQIINSRQYNFKYMINTMKEKGNLWFADYFLQAFVNKCPKYRQEECYTDIKQLQDAIAVNNYNQENESNHQLEDLLATLFPKVPWSFNK